MRGRSKTLRALGIKPASASPLTGYASSLPRQSAYFSSALPRQAKNQIFDPIRNSDSFHTHLSLCSSLRTPFLTFWTASWCPTCHTLEPLLRSLISSGVGEAQGGVLFAPVQLDAPEMMSSSSPVPAMTYAITSVPTLLSFDAGEAQVSTKVTDAMKLADRAFLVDWICTEAKRQGGRGGGGGKGGIDDVVGAAFGGLFGSRR